MQMRNHRLNDFVKRYRGCVFSACVLLTLGICGKAVVLRYDSLFDLIKSVPLLGLVVSYNFPPSDYYEPVLQFPVHAKEFKGIVSFKYEGRYDVQIANVNTPQLYHSGVSLKVQIYDKCSTLIWHSSVVDSRLFAYGPADYNGYRYVYGTLFVPKDVPAKEWCRVTVSCTGGLEEFLSSHPDAVVQIRKCFDK